MAIIENKYHIGIKYVDKDRLLRLYVDEHPDKQDSIRNFFLGVGTYDINIIRNNCFSDEKKNTK